MPVPRIAIFTTSSYGVRRFEQEGTTFASLRILTLSTPEECSVHDTMEGFLGGFCGIKRIQIAFIGASSCPLDGGSLNPKTGLRLAFFGLK